MGSAVCPGSSAYFDLSTGETYCRCVVCARCGQHTGNSSQGHYWKYCKLTKTMRAFHFCCPDNCELETLGATPAQAS